MPTKADPTSAQPLGAPERLLVNRVHADGRVDATEHTADGTRIKARVPIALAANLREFATY